MPDAKVYVNVVASFNKDGQIIPLSITWEDGHQYVIDKVLNVRPAASMKAGGQGDRYTIRICEKESYLFFEHSSKIKGNSLGRWFVEGKG